MKNNFDFNKLFNKGVNYQRLSDEELIKQKVEQKAKDLKSVISVKRSEGAKFFDQRAY